MKQYPFVDLRLANEPYEEELKAAACAVIESGRYLHGPQTDLLEEEVAAVCGTRYCVAVSNGLDALRLILRAWLELGRLHEGDAVLLPANTYIASALAVSDNGLVPLPVDIDPLTMNLDTSLLEAAMTPRVKAVMPVHLYGTPCFDNSLRDFVERHKMLIIEDNAQAIGAVASVDGLNGSRATGSLGHAAGMSFYPTKNIGALGDAGAVTTDDRLLADTVRTIANYGSDRRYHNIYHGLNCRIDELQAAMLRVKLRHIEQENDRRRAVAQAYNDDISHPDVIVPRIFDTCRQVWHQYVIRCTRRDALAEHLKAHGIATDVHYPTPVFDQPCYSHSGQTTPPVTTRLTREILSLPVAYPVTPDDARHIAMIINKF